MRTKAIAVAALSVLPLATHAQLPNVESGYQVTGRLLMADGTPVPPNGAIELTCNGKLNKRVRPYTNGDFVLMLGNDASELPDVVAPGNGVGQRVPFDPRWNAPSTSDAGRFDLSGCEVRGVLPGYQSNVIAIGPRRLLDKPDIGQLVLRRGVAPDGIAVTANTLSAPEKARRAFGNARKILEKDKPEYAKAARELEKAVIEYPRFAAAWNLMGRTRLALNDTVGSREAFNKSIEADPKYAEPHLHLARLEADEGHWGDTINAITQLQLLNPHLPEAHYLRAFAHFQLGEFDSAEQSALEVQKLSELDRYPLTHYILGAIDARRGNFESAAVKLRQFLQTKPDAQLAESVSKILAEWELDDKTKTGR